MPNKLLKELYARRRAERLTRAAARLDALRRLKCPRCLKRKQAGKRVACSDCGITSQQIADRLGISRAWLYVLLNQMWSRGSRADGLTSAVAH